MENFDYNIYVLAEKTYVDNHLQLKRDQIFPYGWYENKDYRTKNMLIAAAIKENKLIEETNSYKELVLKRSNKE